MAAADGDRDRGGRPDLEPATALLTHAVAGGDYDGLAAPSVQVQVTDDDAAALVVEPGSLALDQGAEAELTVKLTAQPASTVSVAAESDNPDVTARPSSLSFTTANWSTPRTVTVRSAVDDDYEDETATLTLSASRGGYDGVSVDVPVTVTDLDTPALEVADRTITTTGRQDRDTLLIGDSKVETDVRTEVPVSIELPEVVPEGLEIEITEVAADVPLEQAGFNFGTGGGVVVDIVLQVGNAPGTAQRLCLPVPRGASGSPVLLRYDDDAANGGANARWVVVSARG